MKGFLYRDLCEMKRLSKFVAIILVCFGVVAFMGKPSTIQFMLPIYCILMFVNQIMNEDEKNGWMAFASVIPNGRRNMVKSKYVALLLVTGTVLLLETLLSVGLAVMGRQGLILGIQISLVSVGVAVLMAEISLPAEYTFGYRDGAFFATVMAVLLLAVTGAAAYKGMQACDWDLRGLNIMVIVPIIAAIAFRLSYRASVSACERRDF